MVTVEDPTAPRHADLKARLMALNCELQEEQTEGAGRFYVLDRNIGKLVSVGATLQDTYDWCAGEEIANRTTRLRDRLETMHRRRD